MVNNLFGKMGILFVLFFGQRLESKLTDQQDILKKAEVPMPLYTCLHVKKNVSAEVFHGMLLIFF